MDTQVIFRVLRDTLADLYRDKQSAIRIADDAALEVPHIQIGDKAIDNWHAILQEAVKKDKIENLLAVVLAEFPNNKRLRIASDNFRSIWLPLINEKNSSQLIISEIPEAPQKAVRTPRRLWLLVLILILAVVIYALPWESWIPSTELPEPPTRTPRSAAEESLYKYLDALQNNDRKTVAQMTSHYSLEYYEKTAMDVELGYGYPLPSGVTLISYDLIGEKSIEENVTRLFYTTIGATKDEKTLEGPMQFALHKDADGIWRVNANEMVDYRILQREPIENPEVGITIYPEEIVRHINQLVVQFQIDTPSGGFSWSNSSVVFCRFGDSQRGAAFKNALLYLEDFFEDYPMSCKLPALIDSELQKKNLLLDSWSPPEIEMKYQ